MVQPYHGMAQQSTDRLNIPPTDQEKDDLIRQLYNETNQWKIKAETNSLALCDSQKNVSKLKLQVKQLKKVNRKNQMKSFETSVVSLKEEMKTLKNDIHNEVVGAFDDLKQEIQKEVIDCKLHDFKKEMQNDVEVFINAPDNQIKSDTQAKNFDEKEEPNEIHNQMKSQPIILPTQALSRQAISEVKKWIPTALKISTTILLLIFSLPLTALVTIGYSTYRYRRFFNPYNVLIKCIQWNTSRST